MLDCQDKQTIKSILLFFFVLVIFGTIKSIKHTHTHTHCHFINKENEENQIIYENKICVLVNKQKKSIYIDVLMVDHVLFFISIALDLINCKDIK